MSEEGRGATFTVVLPRHITGDSELPSGMATLNDDRTFAPEVDA
jgi:hypothetical protein